MKLYSVFCVAVSAQFDFSNGFGSPVDDEGISRKVPPRTPPQRLETLGRFINEWLDDHMTTVASYDSWKRRADENTARMERAYNRKSCAYFNPDLPHGGPNPNPRQDRVTHPKNRRRRRSLDQEFSVAKGLNDDEVELFSPYEEIDQFGRSMGDLTRYDRDNPLIAIRQITTGFRKWADRYIAECHGQRVYNYQKKRMTRWFKSLGQHYMKLNADDQPNTGY